MSHRVGAWALRGGALLATSLAVGVAPASATDECPNAAIRAQQGVTGLGECRAYEQVSPVEKHGNDVLTTGNLVNPVVQSSLDGRSVAYVSTGGFADTPGVVLTNYYLASRSDDPAAWLTQSLTTRVGPNTQFTYGSTIAVAPDGSKTVVGSLAALTPGAVEGDGNVYMRDNRSGALELIFSNPELTGVVGWGLITAGGSTDFSHYVFTATQALTADAVEGDWNVYDWTGHRLRLVSLGPDGTALADSLPASRDDVLRVSHDVSEDGSRIYFSARSEDGNHLFVREHGSTTRRLGVSRYSTGPNAQQTTRFGAASSDGTKVVFAAHAPLTDEPGSPRSGERLYRYDTVTDTLTNLTAYPESSDPETQSVPGVWGASADLSAIYFSSGDVFAPGAVEDANNLYLWHDGDVRLVATLDPSYETAAASLSDYRVYVGEDGDLVFSSRAPLTGYDNVNPACAVGRCAQVFVFDLRRDELVCASCPQDGARPVRDSEVGGQQGAQPTVIGSYPRAALADGSVFFNTPQGLSPQDTNGQLDVYRYRAGSIQLVSSGRGDADARFADASPDADDVFFTTAQQLVPQDRDDLNDLYDARRGGGIAAQLSTRAAVSCESDECQGAPAAGPAAAELGSRTSAGAGNAPVTRRPTSARLVLPRNARGRTVTARVVVSGAGTIAVSGASVRSATRRVRRAGTYALRMALRPAAARRLGARGSVRSRIRVVFRPAAGRSVSTSATLTFRERARASRSAHRSAGAKGGRS